MCINRLILGDNLEVLKAMEGETVDLIYLDPPFFSNRDYEVIWGDEGEVRSFQDRWAGGIEHYIAWLKERVGEMHRVLKPAGSIFLHCDWHANAYIRVEILDRIFGKNNFRNEIVWCYRGGGAPKRDFGRRHDTIFRYGKSQQYTFNTDSIRIPYQAEGIGRKDDAMWGKHRGSDKVYKPNPLGKIPEDWWFINTLNANDPERIGYPTQKPRELLERIIKCASNEGDLVLDPFMGGGTTIAVADKLGRKWIGIDHSVQAVKVTELRLHQQTDLFTDIYANSYTLQLHKYDYDMLRSKDAFEFESWIIGQLGGTSNAKQRSDFGIDGAMCDGTPVQVKRSESVGRNVVDSFLSAAQRYDKKAFEKNVAEQKPTGYIVAFSFSKGAVEEVARLKLKEGIIINLVSVDTIIPVSKKPCIKIEVNELSRDASGVREVEFTAAAKSDAGIEFYSWDFEYSESKGFKPLVIRDITGRQQHGFKAGVHHIAVKAVDNDGLENIETIKLKVNGTVERQ
ncbi:MAG: hypothetical protein LBL94_09845 [Prevotellaceae bacterium]|jgi:DNA modification methylase|nr:hypothetical protein [Prevotellaceae bacterium]